MKLKIDLVGIVTSGGVPNKHLCRCIRKVLKEVSSEPENQIVESQYYKKEGGFYIVRSVLGDVYVPEKFGRELD